MTLGTWFNTLPFDNQMPKYSYKDGILEITGSYMTLDSYVSFSPFMDELKRYSQSSNDIIVKFNLEFINTQSLRPMKKIISELNLMQERGGKVEVYFFYDDDDERLEEQGEDFKYSSEFKFKMIKK